MIAEDDYRNGGPVEPFREAIETTCRERPELAAKSDVFSDCQITSVPTISKAKA